MKKNFLLLIIILSISIISFAQKSVKEPQYQMTNSKNNPQVIVADSLKVQKQVPKHKVESKKQAASQTIPDVEIDSLPPSEKNKLIINKKKQ